jgi:hypothetical protein
VAHFVIEQALSECHGGRLATFDRSIPLKAVIGATGDSLELLGR